MDRFNDALKGFTQRLGAAYLERVSVFRVLGPVLAGVFLLGLVPEEAIGQGVNRPSISGFAPGSGAPGITVVINGNNFFGVTEVRFNTSPALFDVISGRQLTATVPIDATSGPISVSTSFGTVVSAASFFVAPRIAEFAPTNGLPGEIIVIDGANFTGATSVQFNNKNASGFFVVGPTQIHATIPPAASSGPIRIVTPVGAAVSTNNFVVIGTEPLISEFMPANGIPGTIVTIEGRNFSGATAVKFNGTNSLNFSVTAPTQIQAVVPAGAKTGPISVTAPGGTGLSPRPFVITTAPIISGFSPTNGPPGTVVVIDGFNFTGATSVKFNQAGATQFAIPSPTQILATVPTNATTGPIQVTTHQGSGKSSGSFTVATQPIITQFMPTNGPAGTLVTIDGINFEGATRVTIGTNAASFAMVGPTQITATVPTNALSGTITITTPRGSGTSRSLFTVTGGVPFITDFHPRLGVPGIQVIIEGLHFNGATAVRFDGRPAEFTVTAPTQIITTVPLGATSGLISIVNTNGTGSSAVPFLVGPRLISLTPTNGLAGDLVQLRGTNFTQVTAVKFNEANSVFTVVSPNQINATVPANAVSGPVSVSTPAGVATSTNRFVVLPRLDQFTPQAGPAGTLVTLRGSGLAEASSVDFGGVPAAFKVISPNEIQTTVPARAVTGSITVATADGQSRSSRIFTVSRSADLTLSVAAPASPFILGGNLTNVFEVKNLGPSEGTGLRLANHLPESVLFRSAQATRGTFLRTGGLLSWEISSLPAGTNALLTVVFTPTAAGALTNRAQVLAAEFDPILTNNLIEWVTTAVPGPTTLRIEFKAPDQIILGWSVAATNFNLQTSSQLPPLAEWKNVTNRVTISNERRTVTVPLSPESRFFRLVRP